MSAQDSEALAGTLTQLIGQIDLGDHVAQAKFCELVYNELRVIGRRLCGSNVVCSLAGTDIVHDFLGRILADGRLGQMKNRRYFYTAAADQMRRLLIDHFRRKRTQAQGGNRQREDLDPWLDELTDSAASRCGGDLEALDVAMARLKKDRPRQYEIVQLKFFAGLTNEQIAQSLEISTDTVKRDWKIARARLGACLNGG
jgi:RNA polymerase sigma factor (TIGR02999 family)